MIIRNRFRTLAFLPALALSVIGSDSGHGQAPKPPMVSMPETQRTFLKRYCVRCHNAEITMGQVRLDTLPFEIESVEMAERWQKVLNMLNAGEMPPEGAKQPSNEEKTAFLDDLSNTMVRARKLLGDTGGVMTMRRLNRREYLHTMRDLLGVTPEATELPNDASPGTFDTTGSSLFFSGDQFEQYLKLARAALDEAIVVGDRQGPETIRKRTEVEIAANAEVQKQLDRFRDQYQVAKQWEAAKGKKPVQDFGFEAESLAQAYLEYYPNLGPSHALYLADPLTQKGAYLTPYYPNLFVSASIPEDAPPGKYLLRLRIARAGKHIPVERSFIEMGHRVSRYESTILGTYQITGTIEEPQTLEIPVHVRAPRSPNTQASKFMSERMFVFCEKTHQGVQARGRVFYKVQEKNHVGPDPALWIDWVEWEGPLVETWPPKCHQQIFFKGKVGDDAKNDAYAREIIARFAGRALRGRQPGDVWLDRLLALYQDRRQQGDSFETALKEPLAVVLASPGFLYLAEPVGAGQRNQKLNGYELASRLSYFLWSAPPDEELLAAARKGNLGNSAALRQQVDRMLRDPKAFDFVVGFASQWLSMERLEFFDFNDVRFPRFDGSVKLAAREEVYHTLHTVLRENLGVGQLLKSDFVVVNGLLANYYGLDGVTGDEFRKVKLPPDSKRGGLLSMAAVLAMGSDGERTSPVERGAWVLRKLLHQPPPPAPPNVPQLSRLTAGKIYPARELLAAHQEQAQCAQCHRKIDSIGFGLENFDAAGVWRTEETIEITEPRLGQSPPKVLQSKTFPIDSAGEMSDGIPFAGYEELRDLVAGRVDAFARGLVEALIAYGLGRPLSFSDEQLLQTLLAETKAGGYRLADLIHAVVRSKQFRMKRLIRDRVENKDLGKTSPTRRSK